MARPDGGAKKCVDGAYGRPRDRADCWDAAKLGIHCYAVDMDKVYARLNEDLNKRVRHMGSKSVS